MLSDEFARHSTFAFKNFEQYKITIGNITMKRAPYWTPDEFEILLRSPDLSADNLHLKLPNRTPDAIQIVRSGIHAFHTGKNTSMLSNMMIRRLEGDTSSLVCPICEEPLE